MESIPDQQVLWWQEGVDLLSECDREAQCNLGRETAEYAVRDYISVHPNTEQEVGVRQPSLEVKPTRAGHEGDQAHEESGHRTEIPMGRAGHDRARPVRCTSRVDLDRLQQTAARASQSVMRVRIARLPQEAVRSAHEQREPCDVSCPLRLPSTHGQEG